MQLLTSQQGEDSMTREMYPVNLTESDRRAMAFFQRADSECAPATEPRPHSVAPALVSNDAALAFFSRAELSETLQKIWGAIKGLPVGTVLKVVKAVGLVAAVAMLSQNITLTGIIALAGAIGGVLFAAITNLLAWLVYVPLYIVNTPDFATSLLLAVGLAWLGGVAPYFALMFSPMIMFGSRLLARTDAAEMTVSELARAPANLAERLDIGAAIQQASNAATGLVSCVLPRLKLALPTA